MPRPLRQFEVGGIYHIVNRGVEKRKIFLKNQDFSRFIIGLEFFNHQSSTNLWPLLARVGPGPTRDAQDTIGERLKEQRGQQATPLIELLAFTLMPNHYHLIIREITDGGISLFMNKMGGYAIYFNKQYGRVGPLFQSRYKAVSAKNDFQLGNAFVYVHTNPVELQEPQWKDLKVKNPKNALNWLETYRWSSYHDYVGNPTFPTVTQRDFFLDFYKGEKGCRQAIEDWVMFKAGNAQLGSEIIE